MLVQQLLATPLPETKVLHLPRVHSDHYPILLDTNPFPTLRPTRPFRFETIWFSDPSIFSVIKNNWLDNTLPFSACVNLFVTNVKLWNKLSFGNIFHRKKHISSCILGVQKSLETHPSPFLFNLEKSLVKDFNDILKLEEEFWAPKSRINFVLDGDKNTKFFHQSTLTCCRRNKILAIRDSNNNWIFDEPSIKTSFISHYSSLFSTATTSTTLTFPPPFSFPQIDTHLANKLQIPITTNLGKYLGCPIHHTRPSANSFSFIVEQIQNKLTGWKSKLLSLSGRVTLIKAVNSVIPKHVMQCNHIPKSVTNKIDKLNRDFLWGTTSKKKKIHSISWDNIAKPKKVRGLDIRQASLVNKVNMAKLNWRLLSEKHKLWAKVLNSKPRSKSSILSPTWKGINKGAELFQLGSKILIRNGLHTSFWFDNWLGPGPLRSLKEGPLTLSD
ncbi:hypothetical protein ACSBR2_027336 [Camellia fascicularis]